MKNTLLIFSKMHGLGNDYVVIDESKKEIIPEYKKPEIVEELCRRGFSIGADGVIFVVPPTVDKADIRFRIFNADGSEAEMCGNGIRCFAKFVYENGIVPHDEMVVETLGGIKYLELIVRSGEVLASTVDMGKANFKADAIPMINPLIGTDEFMDQELIVDSKPMKMSAVSVGNPHAVIFTDEDLETIDLDYLGPLIENHEAFPQKTNVHFVNIINRGEIKMLTWERGAGFTYACGTGATSCALVGYKLGKLDENVLVHLPGGDLFIVVYPRDGGLGAFMEGDAVLAFDGVVEVDI
ncbi:diaminopimelate epimerase [Methanobacterium paludis]|uniref:Diaminopimelate epimerase n=1 Tax=Methanobacterium paludis (strain DSM 25820 / JCM 18151 / SWAN1) TaxID=868131 RepID=F6D6G9_METPW|nr:diaminopimelate epimerase [Methanobacterium paludis]AEG19402.1 Diaminopimelate epimerase [Methanobacterium paludis]